MSKTRIEKYYDDRIEKNEGITNNAGNLHIYSNFEWLHVFIVFLRNAFEFKNQISRNYLENTFVILHSCKTFHSPPSWFCEKAKIVNVELTRNAFFISVESLNVFNNLL